MIIDGVKILKLWRYFAASLYVMFQFYSHVRYEVLVVVPLKMKVFCDVRLCQWANSSCFFLYCLTLTIKALWLCKMSGTTHPMMQHHIPKILIKLIRIFGMWCCIIGWVVSDILQSHSAFIVRVKQYKKKHELFAQWHSLTSQKTFIFRGTTTRTSYLTWE